MALAIQIPFSGPVSVFQERRLPETASPAGYSALIGAYGLKVPLPRLLCAIGARHRVLERDGWRILTPRHAPAASLDGHLTFALKYEGLDLAVLKRLFLATGPTPVEALVRAKPTGTYARRIWFLYEWLNADRLDLPDAQTGKYTDVLDTSLQWGVAGETAPRYRLRNNLPGTSSFCPLVFRTEKLEKLIALDLPQRAKDIVADIPRDLLARTAAFLLLKDSKSSYAIEGEHPPQDRIQRWGRAIGEAGRKPLDTDELLRLQRIVIGDARFIKLGFRDEGGFVGEHDRDTRLPLPDHISAKAEDLPALVRGMIAFAQGPAQKMDAVIAAAVLAFGFIYIHPFEDGNGRLHRYLIHHVLAERGYNPPGLVFPVSAAILDQIDCYRETLETYSQRLLPHVSWEPTAQFNVRVLNDTADFYRFFDATPHAEFLYDCVQRTIEHDLPYETDFLRRYDEFHNRIQAMVDMPERTVDLLFRFLKQNSGKVSNRARAREFAALNDEEVEKIEAIFAKAFEVPPGI
ncbi:Fic family protein [Indioceanicola profundi]|uniref:Fic family protein n=1 Tax=Indioceanicola profundi TaxID=2220096 RepID=UPI000E6ABC58|nr:Fic family protein [Indioceanicola profundi]